MATDNLPTNVTPCAAVTVSGDDARRTVTVPTSAQTLDGFRKWALSEDFPERGHFTFAAGEVIVDMSPESLETHNLIKTEVTTTLHQRAKTRRLGRVISDRFLFSNSDAGISTEPDATFATYESFQSGRCQVVRSQRPGVSDELIGSPDWVLEIVSPSSIRKDKKLLRDGYFRAGVGEYWLVDALGDDVDFQMLVLGDGGYVVVEPRDGWLASPIFGCSFRLTREIDEDGFLQYTLHQQ